MQWEAEHRSPHRKQGKSTAYGTGRNPELFLSEGITMQRQMAWSVQAHKVYTSVVWLKILLPAYPEAKVRPLPSTNPTSDLQNYLVV